MNIDILVQNREKMEGKKKLIHGNSKSKWVTHGKKL